MNPDATMFTIKMTGTGPELKITQTYKTALERTCDLLNGLGKTVLPIQEDAQAALKAVRALMANFDPTGVVDDPLSGGK